MDEGQQQAYKKPNILKKNLELIMDRPHREPKQMPLFARAQDQGQDPNSIPTG